MYGQGSHLKTILKVLEHVLIIVYVYVNNYELQSF